MMRFHFGEIPKPDGFRPEVEGWSDIWDPSPLLLNVFSIFSSLLMLALVIGLLTLAWEGGPAAIWRNTGAEANLPQLLLFLAVIVLSIPVHEVLHSLAHPQWGSSSKSMLGLWLSRGLFYTHYEGEMSRNRFLAVFAAPFVILSLLPITLIALLSPVISPMMLWYLALVALVNGVLCAGDVIGFILVLIQIPSEAMVRNHGWNTYWKIKVPRSD